MAKYSTNDLGVRWRVRNCQTMASLVRALAPLIRNSALCRRVARRLWTAADMARSYRLHEYVVEIVQEVSYAMPPDWWYSPVNVSLCNSSGRRFQLLTIRPCCRKGAATVMVAAKTCLYWDRESRRKLRTPTDPTPAT